MCWGWTQTWQKSRLVINVNNTLWILIQWYRKLYCVKENSINHPDVIMLLKASAVRSNTNICSVFVIKFCGFIKYIIIINKNIFKHISYEKSKYNWQYCFKNWWMPFPPFLNMSSAKAKLCFWNLVQSIDTENLYNFVKYKIGPIRFKSDGKTVITLTFPRNDLH